MAKKERKINGLKDCYEEIGRMDAVSKTDVMEAVLVEALNSEEGYVRRQDVLKRLTGVGIANKTSIFYVSEVTGSLANTEKEAVRIMGIIAQRREKFQAVAKRLAELKNVVGE